MYHQTCTVEEYEFIFKAWKDSKRLADALNSFRPNEAYQKALDIYMGTGSRDELADLIQKHGVAIENDILMFLNTARRRRGLNDGKSEYYDAHLWIYCNGKPRWFGHCKENEAGVTLAYEEEDRFFNNWYMTFCPAFYRILKPLDDVIKDIRDNSRDPRIAENWMKASANTFHHETFHFSKLVTDPQALDGDKTYGPEKVYKRAEQKGSSDMTKVADGWAWASTAILAQNEFNLADPPYPQKCLPVGVTPTGEVAEVPNIEHTLLTVPADFIPDGADPREDDKPYKIDYNYWTIYDPGPIPSCYGETPFRQPTANDAIDKFCTDPRWTKQTIAPTIGSGKTGTTSSGRPIALGVSDYVELDGTEDNLWLFVGVCEDCMGTGRFDFEENACKENLKAILNGCDNQTTEKKLGGHLAKGGIASMYRLTARPRGQEDPFPLTRMVTEDTSEWTWKCKDTDSYRTDLQGTCTCWFEEMDNIYEYFNKPEWKGCGDVEGKADPKWH
ncbi:hypothetical protein K469DRAFT_798553 [Zopfia rhizophila CBS 207.26]|uniref:Lysine-specific metallo-endopeptidase domain-containing protein n=1 Tax=Zopfia rhizophila CBS 207.26 TaxID=1314779 RepID=A0A6A6DKT5_9PEZI|nr:hypothetical protein K469DRAFT_798553 [Zopfia rhizophila CBS 207.26]